VEQRSVSYLSWRVTTALTELLTVIAVACVVAEVVIWTLTFAGSSITMPDWIFSPFFAFAILGTIALVVMSVITYGRDARPQLGHIRQLPGWALGLLAALGLGFIVAGPLQLFASLPGQPGYNAYTGQYYFNDHGQVIPTDRSHYLSAVATQTRGFLSFAVVLTCVMIVFGGTEVRRRRSVSVSTLHDIAVPRSPRPKWAPRVRVGVGMVVIGLLLGAVGLGRIGQRVDSYLGTPVAVTTKGTTELLTSGPWVVFTWCETHATFADYGCAQLDPDDIVIQDATTGIPLATAIDPSTDHISPEELPAAGQLTFSVPRTGMYTLRLTRPVPKGVFVNKSPGTIARSLAAEIALTLVAIVAMVGGVLLLVRRIGWRFSEAPRVVPPSPAS
jgi:hypothetical protein